MVTYAYLRVSTDHQDLDNQRHGIFEYANTQNLSSLKFVEDATSGRIKWQSRAGRITATVLGLAAEIEPQSAGETRASTPDSNPKISEACSIIC
ncbi:MAG: recombinase family protein [Cyanobacteria bacterium J06592_8]